MPYEVLEKIRSIPEKYAAEFSDYVDEFISKIEEPKETFEEEQARKQAAIQAMLDWAKAVHCRSTEDWTREELYDRGLEQWANCGRRENRQSVCGVIPLAISKQQ